VIRTNDYYASQFPNPIGRNGGKPRTGVIVRKRQDGLLVVKFDDASSHVVISPKYIEEADRAES